MGAKNLGRVAKGSKNLTCRRGGRGKNFGPRPPIVLDSLGVNIKYDLENLGKNKAIQYRLTLFPAPTDK